MALSTRAAAAASTRCRLLKAMTARIDRIIDFESTIVVVSVEQDYLHRSARFSMVQGGRWKVGREEEERVIVFSKGYT